MCLVLLSLVAAAFLANKDVYKKTLLKHITHYAIAARVARRIKPRLTLRCRVLPPMILNELSVCSESLTTTAVSGFA